MGCVQSRDDSPRSEGSAIGGAAAPVSADPAFLAEVHRKRIQENAPGAAYKEQQDALGRYEALVDAAERPIDYRSRNAAWLRAETAKRRGAPL